MNAKMALLRRCFERAGFTDVKTVLASGNVAFSARASSPATLERKAEAAMAKHLGRTFFTLVRSQAALRKLLASDPYRRFRLPAKAKRVVTFVRKPGKAKLRLPIEVDGARILAVKGGEIFTAYVPSARGAVFMQLIQRTFGRDVTTRTWDTVKKCAAA
jgi:uncharacterized protein (DUF1697 family)